MGRKSKKDARRRGARDDDSDSDSADSMTPSVMSTASVLPADEDALNDLLKENVEYLTEKRAAIRVAALKKINQAFSQQICSSFIEDHSETLNEYLLSSFKKRDRKGEEKALIARCIKLFYITLGTDAEALYADAEEHLLPLMHSAKAASDKALAFDMMAVIAFVGSGEDDKTEELLEKCVPAFTSTTASLAVSAIQAWTLIATTLGAVETATEGAKIIQTLMKLLAKENADVQLAVGQALALIYESHWIALGESDRYQKTTLQRVVDINHVVRELKELAIDNSRYKSKKDLSVQRANFRAIHRIVEDGEVPLVSLKVGQNNVDFDQWSTIVQYDTLKAILGTGFQQHCKYNDLLRDVFDLEGHHVDDTERMSERAKRKYKSKNSEASKARTRERLADRDKNNRTRRMSHLGDED